MYIQIYRLSQEMSVNINFYELSLGHYVIKQSFGELYGPFGMSFIKFIFKQQNT